MNQPLNKYSSKITQPKSQGASQAMLYATGMQPEDMDKAQVGIASVWYEGNSCNMQCWISPRSKDWCHSSRSGWNAVQHHWGQ